MLLMIVLPDVYFDWRYLRRGNRKRWLRPLWWLLSLSMMILTVYLSFSPKFVPDDRRILYFYLALVGLVIAPKTIYVLCSFLGLLWRRLRHSRKNWGNLVGFFLSLFSIYAAIYGWVIGPEKLKINRVDVYFENLPKSFDGYKIVHFSDLHAGSFEGSRQQWLVRALDSINAQHADLIAFTGDLQNMEPHEIYPIQGLLRSLVARNGVISVLGNHDYAEYINEDPVIEAANCRETIARQRQMGWNLLLNDHTVLRRGTDSIVVAGEQNFDRPDSVNFAKTMKGVGSDAFTIMLQHNPGAWDHHIRTDRRIALTLSGHVHGGQVALFGLRPSSLFYMQDWGLYQQGEQAIYVTSGLGAMLPFRFGVPPEIAVIVLHRKNP